MSSLLCDYVTMADIILPPVLQVFLENLASPILEKLGNMWDMQENVRKLQDNLSMVQALLEDAEDQQATNRAVRIWLSKLNDVALDVEDLLIDFAVHEARITEVGFADRVKMMLSELDSIVDEGLGLNLRERVITVRREWDRRETSYFVVESEVYGREEDKEKIIELLLSCEASEKGCVSCIPIVGMGGLGKTTLAQLAYNDHKVAQYFDVKVWIFVSDHFDAKNIMMGLIECLTKDKCHFSNMNMLHSEVWCLLRNKRYLIVLDDVWTEDQDDWDKLKPLFQAGTDGSKILITTRSVKVALMMDCPTFPYYLGGLSEGACWSLFKKRAFRPGEEEANQNLLLIGQEIVRKCGGVALAAKTLGGLMRFKREEKEWLYVQESEIWKLDEYGNTGILPALRLSYSRLPPHLKRCFSFCSIFPRGYEIKKEKLILMWMAEGLIQSSKGNKSPEQIGNEYFVDLLWMSFLKEIKHGDNGVVTRYKMHDVIYDLAQSIVGPDFAVLDSGFPAASSVARIRHSSVVCDFKSSVIPEKLYEATRLRTLLLFSGGNFGEAPPKLYSNFKYLLVLDLSGSGLFTLDGEIDRLACLRYLDLSHTHIKRLPCTLENLQSLETLNLFNCYELKALPNILRMKNLRHLDNGGCEALTNTLSVMVHNKDFNAEQREAYINRLRKFPNKLRTFPLLVVGGPPDIMFLGNLNQLQGSLKIIHLENIHAEDAKSAFMFKKRGIESLGLYWGNEEFHSNINPEEDYDVIRYRKRNEIHSDGSSQGIEVDASMGELVLKNLQPHQNLKRLLIKGYPGILFPHWRMAYLKMLDLIDCRRSKYLPETLANLQFLNSLSLRAMHSVTRIGQQFYGQVRKPFPVLKELVLIDFPILEEWLSPEGREAFPSLRKLVVSACPQLTLMPLFLSVKHLELRDCNAVVVHSFQNLTSLKSLVIEKVRELLCFSGTFPANNPLLASLEIMSCPQLHHLPFELGNLTALKSLTIRWCEELSHLPPSLQNLNALEFLEISDCHSLLSLPDSDHQSPGLSNLRTLSIENCNNLASISIGFQCLSSLQNLTIMYCPSLVKLPQGVECLSSLRSLTILSCPQLMSLPEELQNLMFLHSLEIRNCSSLKALPDWIVKLVSLRSLAISECHGIRFLPEGIECLTALQYLSIQDCPQLVERCRAQNGEDWPKIAHVPYKHIASSGQICPSEASCSSSSN